MWGRIKRLWKLSELPKAPQRTWNGEPVLKDVFEEKMGFKTTQTPNQPAVFIPRIKRDPVDQIINEQPQ